MRRLRFSIRLSRGLGWAGLLAFAGHAAPPGAKPPSELLQVGIPDQAEGRAVIEQFRTSGPPRPYYLEFKLERIPRRGPVTSHPGRLWGGRNDEGNILRIELDPGTPDERRFLLQNGPKATVWETERSGGLFPAPKRYDLFAPLLPAMPVAAFDLEMPFLYWPDERLVDIERVRGRMAHVFVFHPPAASAVPADVALVRADLDTQFRAPIETELVAKDGEILKTFSLLDLKRVGDEWLPSEIDVRDERTHDKGRFEATAAALNLDLLPGVFAPENLAEGVAPPPPDTLSRF